jgi:hypothetical protein
MGKGLRRLAGALSLAVAAQAAPASAQYMPHLDPNLYIFATMGYGAGVSPCMTGTPMADAKIAEARAPSLAAMQAYFAAAQRGTPKSAAFRLDKKSKWQGGGASAGQLDIDRQTDPLAVAGHVLEAEPLRFYRGGAGATALGQWAVLDAGGQVAGVYTGFFVRSKKLWKLRELTVAGPEETVEPAAQFCVKPGDVMEHRLTSTRNWHESAAKSVDEAQNKLDAAIAQVAAAEAAAATDPKRSGPAQILRTARADQARWTKQLEKRQKNLADAIEKSAEAEKDAAELKRLTGPARTAQAFRIAPDAGAAERATTAVP